MVVTHTHVKDQGQWSVSSKDRVEPDGRTDRWMQATALPPTLTQSVTIHTPHTTSDLPQYHSHY